MDTRTLERTGLAAGLVLVWAATAAQALPRWDVHDLSPLRERGAEVRSALLVEYYSELPQPEDSDRGAWAVRLQSALAKFKKKVAARYTEGSLQRLTDAPSNQTRRAAVVALGLLGTMNSSKALAARLHDDDPTVRQLTTDALWAIWFRGDNEAHNKELQRLIRLRDSEKALAGFEALIQKAPNFAEAYNQRAIVYFRRGEFDKSIADCEKVLKLNPVHFGAQAGMAQSYMKLKKPRAALKAFRNAFQINPGMEGVEDTIRALEDVLGEEGKKNDDR